MKTILKTGFILFAICALSAGLCGIVNSITAPRIAVNEENAKMLSMQSVASGYEMGSEIASMDEDILSVIPLYENGEEKGYILELVTSGYGGEMTVIASFYSDGELIKVELGTNSETPGLGKKAENESYMMMFRGLGGSSPLPSSKSDLSAENQEVVSGASITFNGISEALRNGSEYVKSLGGGV